MMSADSIAVSEDYTECIKCGDFFPDERGKPLCEDCDSVISK